VAPLRDTRPVQLKQLGSGKKSESADVFYCLAVVLGQEKQAPRICVTFEGTPRHLTTLRKIANRPLAGRWQATASSRAAWIDACCPATPRPQNRRIESIHGRKPPVVDVDLTTGQRDIATRHLESRVAQDRLKGKNVAPSDQVIGGERMTQQMGMKTPDAGSPSQPYEEHFDRVFRDRLAIGCEKEFRPPEGVISPMLKVTQKNLGRSRPER
jgi:hypothetical protein